MSGWISEGEQRVNDERHPSLQISPAVNDRDEWFVSSL